LTRFREPAFVSRELAEPVVLSGRYVRLEPVALDHVPALAAAAAEDRTTFGWTPVPDGEAAFRENVEQVLAEREAGRRLAFATLRLDANGAARVVGSTSFLDPQRWPGGGGRLDGIEIGATWLGASAQRTAVNSEAKLLMLAHAFDGYGVHRVVLNTDARNERSRAAIARIGATFEGVLHSYRYGVEGTPRDTATFAIPARDWPDVRARLEARVYAD
jgi:N-acetyltransferase